MLDLNDLYFFAQVVERKGFTAASRALGVPKSNLSRRILKLEGALGVRLIQRTSRQFVVTEVGAEFYEHCRAVRTEAEEAEIVIRRRLAEPVGRIRFSCPVILGQHVLADVLPRFMRAYPKVQVVEQLTSTAMNLIDEGFDLALRIHGPPLASSDLVQRTVCRVQQLLVASPAFLDAIGRPHGPQDLEGVAGLARNPTDEEPSWIVREDGGREAVIRFKPTFFSNDWLTQCKISAAGFGIAALPFHVCRDSLTSGALERVLPRWQADQGTLTILTPSRRGTLPSVRAFVEFLLKELPPLLSPDVRG